MPEPSDGLFDELQAAAPKLTEPPPAPPEPDRQPVDAADPTASFTPVGPARRPLADRPAEPLLALRVVGPSAREVSSAARTAATDLLTAAGLAPARPGTVASPSDDVSAPPESATSPPVAPGVPAPGDRRTVATSVPHADAAAPADFGTDPESYDASSLPAHAAHAQAPPSANEPPHQAPLGGAPDLPHTGPRRVSPLADPTMRISPRPIGPGSHLLVVGGERHPVPTEAVVLGRDPGPGGLQVTNPEASRRHLVLRPSAQGIELADLGSLNGTRVRRDEQELPVGPTPTVLCSGDTVLTGIDTVLLRVEEEPR